MNMPDIVERLRHNPKIDIFDLCEEAADEIERLRNSSVPCVPDGYWLAPDEPTEEMSKASRLVVTCHCGRRITQWGTNAYRAMRDVAKHSVY